MKYQENIMQLATHLKPKAIYIGVKTAKEQAEKIYTICKQQNFPCYKILQSYVTSDFSLDHIPYEEFAATYYTQNKWDNWSRTLFERFPFHER